MHASGGGGGSSLPPGFVSTLVGELRRQAAAANAATAEDEDDDMVSAAAAGGSSSRPSSSNISGARLALLEGLSLAALPALALAVSEAMAEQTWINGDLTSLNISLPIDVIGSVSAYIDAAAVRWEPAAVLVLLQQIRTVVAFLQVRSMMGWWKV